MVKKTKSSANLIKNIFKYLFLGRINYNFDDIAVPYKDVHYSLESVFPNKETEKKLINYLQNK